MNPKIVQKKFDEAYFKKCRDILLNRKFNKIGCGASRYGFQRGNVVIKVPYNAGGYTDNIMEAYMYNQWRKEPDMKGRFYAPCRLLPDACLMMMFIKRGAYHELPDWLVSMDGGQGGKYHDRIVAYDSAYNITDMKPYAMRWAGLE